VPRNAEVIRQWTILREIESARGAGVTIDDLANLAQVTTRTIRRDLQALEEAGFPVFDDRSHDDGRTRWRLNGQAFKGLGAGLTLSEVCALYFSRALVTSLSGTPFRSEVERAFTKLGAVLSPHMRQFLDQLPRIITTKADANRPPAADASRREAIVARAFDATLHHRVVTLTYFSKSSDRTKQYAVHPYRLAYAQGETYLLAYVPEYDEVRTFAVRRIEELSLREERFTPVEDVPQDAFPDSLGVHSGPPEHIEVDFDPSVADHVRAREWHRSQAVHDRPGGGIRLTLDVCRDHALRSWILSFGALARVVSPEDLASEIGAQLRAATANYDTARGEATPSSPVDQSSETGA
jgi:proteasome accessory factor B